MGDTCVFFFSRVYEPQLLVLWLTLFVLLLLIFDFSSKSFAFFLFGEVSYSTKKKFHKELIEQKEKKITTWTIVYSVNTHLILWRWRQVAFIAQQKKGQHNNSNGNRDICVYIVKFDFSSCIATCCLMYGCKNKIFFSQPCNRRESLTNQFVLCVCLCVYALHTSNHSVTRKRCLILLFFIPLTGGSWWAEKYW